MLRDESWINQVREMLAERDSARASPSTQELGLAAEWALVSKLAGRSGETRSARETDARFSVDNYSASHRDL
jgi:hypothetical protein